MSVFPLPMRPRRCWVRCSDRLVWSVHDGGDTASIAARVSDPVSRLANAIRSRYFWRYLVNLVVLVWTVIKVMLIVAPLLLCVAYTTYAERKIIGAIQVRIGPNRVGPWGLIQPLADGLKVLLKEVVIPANADKAVFLLAPLFAFAPALIAWAVIPFNEFWFLPTSMPVCFSSWRLRRSVCTESFWPVGRRIPSMHSSGQCVRQRK